MKKRNNVVQFHNYTHPKVGDVYEIDDDVLVLVLDKDHVLASVRILNPEYAHYNHYGSSKITLSNKAFTSHNHVGNYDEIVGGQFW